MFANAANAHVPFEGSMGYFCMGGVLLTRHCVAGVAAGADNLDADILAHPTIVASVGEIPPRIPTGVAVVQSLAGTASTDRHRIRVQRVADESKGGLRTHRIRVQRIPWYGICMGYVQGIQYMGYVQGDTLGMG